MRNYFKENKTVLIAFITLAWPTVLEQLLSTVVQYVDTAMVGRLGANATATVSLSSTYGWTINSVIYSIGIGCLSYIARAIGEKNQDKISRAANQAVKAIAIARGYLAPIGVDLVCIPAFANILIDGEERTAIKLICEER